MSDELLAKMDKVLEKAPENRHSYYQLKYFVLGKEPTTQSQLWQCLRELQSRKESIDTIQLQMADSSDELELTNLELEKLSAEDLTYINAKMDVIYKKEKVIKARRLKRKQESILTNINNMEKKLQFLLQEARFFLQAFESLEQVEPLKDYDDFDAQKEYWEAKLAEEINLRLLTRQPLPSDLLKTALSLHNDSQIKEQVTGFLETCRTDMQICNKKENNVRKQVGH